MHLVILSEGVVLFMVTDVERLRKPMQQITDYFLKCMGAQPSAKVIEIHASQEVG